MVFVADETRVPIVGCGSISLGTRVFIIGCESISLINKYLANDVLHVSDLSLNLIFIV